MEDITKPERETRITNPLTVETALRTSNPLEIHQEEILTEENLKMISTSSTMQVHPLSSLSLLHQIRETK